MGIHIIINPRRKEVWRLIVSKIRSKLAAWHNSYLPIGSRVVLLNSILSNILIFFFSFYKTPKVIVKEIIMLQRVFLWGGGEENQEVNWVSWTKVCTSKEDSGLGIKQHGGFNLALLSK